jgi:hypothetical protein
LLVRIAADRLQQQMHWSNTHCRSFCAVGAYNKVAVSLLQQAGVAQSESERPDLVIEAYEKCLGAVPY